MWRDFRKWQLDNRDVYNEDDEYSSYFEEHKQRLIETGGV